VQHLFVINTLHR